VGAIMLALERPHTKELSKTKAWRPQPRVQIWEDGGRPKADDEETARRETWERDDKRKKKIKNQRWNDMVHGVYTWRWMRKAVQEKSRRWEMSVRDEH
jgi:hypothetical protein